MLCRIFEYLTWLTGSDLLSNCAHSKYYFINCISWAPLRQHLFFQWAGKFNCPFTTIIQVSRQKCMSVLMYSLSYFVLIPGIITYIHWTHCRALSSITITWFKFAHWGSWLWCMHLDYFQFRFSCYRMQINLNLNDCDADLSNIYQLPCAQSLASQSCTEQCCLGVCVG
jgi:hypothetical protein